MLPTGDNGLAAGYLNPLDAAVVLCVDEKTHPDPGVGSHRAVEFRKFLNPVNRTVSDELGAHVVLDNVSTHKTPEIGRWLKRHPRFTFHFTQTYGSRMSLVERWFSELATKRIRRGRSKGKKAGPSICVSPVSG